MKQFGLADSLSQVPGIGPQTLLNFQQKNLRTIADLLHFYPLRYGNYQNLKSVAKLQKGDLVSITVRIIKKIILPTRKRRLSIGQLIVSDNSGTFTVIFYNQPFLLKTFKMDTWYALAGQVDYFGSRDRKSVV